MLVSRIQYAENNKSFAKLLKWALLALGLLLLALLVVNWVRPADGFENCQADGSERSVISWLKSLVTGKPDPSRCKIDKEVTSKQSPSGEVHQIVTETKKCPIDALGDDVGDGFSFWNWFNWRHPNCDKVRLQDNLLSKQKPSIKPFSMSPPSLADIQSYPFKYAEHRKFINDTQNTDIRNDIQFLFDEIDREHNWATLVNNRDVTSPDFIAPLTDLDFLLGIQRKAKDLKESGKILADKDGVVDRLKSDFNGRINEKNCADQMAELKKAWGIAIEKKGFSAGMLDSLRGKLRDIQRKIDESMKRKYADGTGPMGELSNLEKEVGALHTAKQRLSSKIGDADGQRLALDRDRLLAMENRIAAAKREIADIDARHSGASAKIQDAKTRLDHALVSLGGLQFKLTKAYKDEEIKNFLNSLIKKDGNEKTLEQLFSETEVTKQQIIKIVRAFMDKSKGYDTVEINWSEEELSQEIEKDQKEFQKIMEIYHELKAMISRYKEVEIKITAYKREIAEKEREKAAADAEWRGLLAASKSDLDRRKNLEDEVARLQIEIKNLQARITGLEQELERERLELSSIEQEMAVKRALKSELDLKHKVR